MNQLAAALAADRLRQDEPAWRALRGDHAATTLVVLRQHLGGQVRRLPADVLVERVEADLEHLREQFDLPQSAKAYCAQWRQEGFLIRRPAAAGTEETYELSDGALAAIAFIDSLVEHRQTVTESRLETIIERLHDLAVETNPDWASRLAALEERRAALDAEIDLVRSGRFEVLDQRRALERARDILGLVTQLPADFAHVRAEIEHINRELRRQLIEDVDSRGAVLEEVFAGIDRLHSSDAGRSFDGFYSLILSAELSERLDADIEALVSREFANQLQREEARDLRRLMPSLQEPAREIHGVMTALSRSLRRFVQSHDFQESGRVHALLVEATKQATELAAAQSTLPAVKFNLDLPGVPLSSVSALALRNPADSRTNRAVEVHESVGDLDLTALREAFGVSEIDLVELTNNVNTAVAEQGNVTIGQVLQFRPASQGVASIVGLVVLAERHGRNVDGSETITWRGPDQTVRHGRIPSYLFVEAIA